LPAKHAPAKNIAVGKMPENLHVSANKPGAFAQAAGLRGLCAKFCCAFCAGCLPAVRESLFHGGKFWLL